MSEQDLMTSSGAQEETADTSNRSPQQARSPAADDSTYFSTSSDDEGTAGVGIPHQLTENSSTISVSDSANGASTSSTNAINADTDDNDNAREENDRYITEQLENMQHNLNNLRMSIESTFPSNNAIFPEEEQLREFEDKIACRDKMICDLLKLKQENLQNTVNKILKKLFSNELLKAYSYHGQKNNTITGETNKNFSELNICSLIMKVLRYMFGPDIKDEEIKKCIQKYIDNVKHLRPLRNN